MKFIGYVGDSDVHDSVITDFQAQDNELSVVLQSSGWKRPAGALFCIKFRGVAKISENNAVGRVIYALAEFECAEPFRLSALARMMMNPVRKFLPRSLK